MLPVLYVIIIILDIFVYYLQMELNVPCFNVCIYIYEYHLIRYAVYAIFQVTLFFRLFMFLGSFGWLYDIVCTFTDTTKTIAI